jgi:hypothetical protein
MRLHQMVLKKDNIVLEQIFKDKKTFFDLDKTCNSSNKINDEIRNRNDTQNILTQT